MRQRLASTVIFVISSCSIAAVAADAERPRPAFQRDQAKAPATGSLAAARPDGLIALAAARTDAPRF
jgi:hypothetical protein